jgi:hypothetical protein
LNRRVSGCPGQWPILTESRFLLGSRHQCASSSPPNWECGQGSDPRGISVVGERLHVVLGPGV